MAPLFAGVVFFVHDSVPLDARTAVRVQTRRTKLICLARQNACRRRRSEVTRASEEGNGAAHEPRDAHPLRDPHPRLPRMPGPARFGCGHRPPQLGYALRRDGTAPTPTTLLARHSALPRGTRRLHVWDAKLRRGVHRVRGRIARRAISTRVDARSHPSHRAGPTRSAYETSILATTDAAAQDKYDDAIKYGPELGMVIVLPHWCVRAL